MPSAKFATASLIALSALFAGSAFAENGQAPTREQVRAEYLAARAAGTLPADGEVDLVMPGVKSLASRAQVQAEYFAARAAGTLPAVGEIGEVAEPAPQSQSGKTRAEVRAEYFQALKAGTLPKVGEHG